MSGADIVANPDVGNGPAWARLFGLPFVTAIDTSVKFTMPDPAGFDRSIDHGPDA